MTGYMARTCFLTSVVGADVLSLNTPTTSMGSKELVGTRSTASPYSAHILLMRWSASRLFIGLSYSRLGHLWSRSSGYRAKNSRAPLSPLVESEGSEGRMFF